MLKERTKLDFTVSQPLVRFRETVRTASPTFEGKSPNKHNKLYISVEPLDEETIRLIQLGEVTDDQDPRERAKILREKAGWDTDEPGGAYGLLTSSTSTSSLIRQQVFSTLGRLGIT